MAKLVIKLELTLERACGFKRWYMMKFTEIECNCNQNIVRIIGKKEMLTNHNIKNHKGTFKHVKVQGSLKR